MSEVLRPASEPRIMSRCVGYDGVPNVGEALPNNPLLEDIDFHGLNGSFKKKNKKEFQRVKLGINQLIRVFLRA